MIKNIGILNSRDIENLCIAVVIPSYKVTQHILGLIAAIGSEVKFIYIVDDSCPDNSGKLVFSATNDPRIRVLFHSENQGVGGAVMTGYKAAISDGADVIVKLDGDGQMDPSLILDFVSPIVLRQADYTKGNRFYDLEKVRTMPMVRLLGNAILSLMTKLSSGYWNLFDPTNGYTAIAADVARSLPFNKISKRYFFETDMLFRLNLLRAVVIDVPMSAKYGQEVSNLKISRIMIEFFTKHLRNFYKRILYSYYLRDMSLASVELPIGLLLIMFGLIYGGYNWLNAAQNGILTPAGTVMLSALPVLAGVQFVLGFIAFDISTVPERPIHKINLIDYSGRVV